MKSEIGVLADNVTPAAVRTEERAWWHAWARVLLLIAVDMAAVLTASAMAVVLWARWQLNQNMEIYVTLLPMTLAFPAAYAVAGLYPGFGLGAVETLRRFSYATSAAFLAFAAASFVFQAPAVYSRMSFALAWLFACLKVPVARFIALSGLKRLPWWRERTVLVGNWEQQRWVVQALRDGVSIGFSPVFLSVVNGEHALKCEVKNAPVGSAINSHNLSTCGAKVALVLDAPDVRQHLASLQMQFAHVIVVCPESQLPVEHLRIYNFGGIVGFELTNGLANPSRRALKRVLDVALGGVLLFVSLPIIGTAALLVALKSPGPVFYTQLREGQNGRWIKVPKIRTMIIDADKHLDEMLASDPDLAAEWARAQKLRRDPRVVPYVGAWLRRLSVDELPQLWSVIKGDMSLVGPRPLPAYHLDRFPQDFRELRRSVRPGITGMWQVMVRSNGDIEQQRVLDTYYIRNWSIWLDLYLLARTVFAVLSARGAV